MNFQWSSFLHLCGAVSICHTATHDDPPHEVIQNVEPLPELHRRLSGFLVLTLSLLSYRVPEQRVLCSRQTASPKNSSPARDFFQKAVLAKGVDPDVVDVQC